MYLSVYTVLGRIHATDSFLRWLRGVRDPVMKARISGRIDRLAIGQLGDCKMIDRNISELRLHFGPGYRVYFTRRGNSIVILLAGGDKWSQPRDIVTARNLHSQLEPEL